MLKKMLSKRNAGFSLLDMMLTFLVTSFVFLGAYRMIAFSFQHLSLSSQEFDAREHTLTWDITLDESISCTPLPEHGFRFIECQKKLSPEDKIIFLVD